MILTDVAVRNRATVAVLTVFILVAGLYSYFTLPREAAPDVAMPLVMITTAYEGVAPEDVETSVTMKIEKELAGLKGLKKISSISAEGTSLITVEFMPDVVIEDALQYVRDRVDIAKPDLPVDAEEPAIREINIAEFPFMLVSISGDVSPVRLKAIADELEDRIESVQGVLGVDVIGALEREIRLEVDPDRLSAYNLTVGELLSLVPAENVNISAGALETEGVKFNVRVPAEFVDPGDIDHLLLAVRDGKPIYLTDVAEIVDTFKDRSSFSRLDGEPSITLAVRKRIGADLLPISDAVRYILARARAQVPAGVKLDVTDDHGVYVRKMVADLENNIFSGLILVVVVMVLFLGWRTSTVVALAIPLSMLISFAVILVMGYTLNMIVLFGLVLALGMLVDNAIVIVENIYRHVQMGKSRTRAALEATGEVAWPVITSTATTVAAFSPLMFWPDTMGEFMKFLPITVVIVLSSSLFVALVISPTICAAFGTGEVRQRSDESRFMGFYTRVLRAAIEHRATALALSVLVLVASGLLYAKLGRGVQLFPDIDPERAFVNLRFPQGTNVRETDRLTRICEERVATYDRYLNHRVANVGSQGSANYIFGGAASGPHVGNVQMVFKDYEERERPSAQVVKEIRGEMLDLTGAEVKVEKQKEGPPTGDAVTVRIIGEDFKSLEKISERARRRIADVPGLVNLRSDLEATRPELVFRVDRRRAMLSGVNSATIGHFLKTAVFGRKVGTYRQFNDEYDITVRLPLNHREDVGDLFNLRLPNNRGESLPLSSLGEFDYRGGFGTINRLDQDRVVTLTGDKDEGYMSQAVLGEVMKRLDGLLTDDEENAGYRVEYAGEKEESDKARAFLGKAFVVALLLIVMILVAQFNSFQIPVIIMTTVFLSMIGVLLGLIFFRMPFGIIMTGVGVISLAGVVVNNAIVLLDYTRKLQLSGMDAAAAAVEAGRTRLRPVLLTAATTILGLIPMITGVSFDFHVMEVSTRSMSSQFWQPMAVAVAFGLFFATVLTLVVVPCLYVSLYRLAQSFGLGGLRRKGPGEVGPAGGGAPAQG